MDWWPPERNSFEEMIIATVVIVIYSIWVLRNNVHQIRTINIAQGTFAYFYMPMGISGVLLVLDGLNWWGSAILGIGTLILGMIATYQSGLYKLFFEFPLFSRTVICILGAYPIVALLSQWLFGPWEEKHRWPLVIFLFGYVALSWISFMQLHKMYSKK